MHLMAGDGSWSCATASARLAGHGPIATMTVRVTCAVVAWRARSAARWRASPCLRSGARRHLDKATARAGFFSTRTPTGLTCSSRRQPARGLERLPGFPHCPHFRLAVTATAVMLPTAFGEDRFPATYGKHCVTAMGLRRRSTSFRAPSRSRPTRSVTARQLPVVDLPARAEEFIFT
jgi:hypothetical protein